MQRAWLGVEGGLSMDSDRGVLDLVGWLGWLRVDCGGWGRLVGRGGWMKVVLGVEVGLGNVGVERW